ncbi:MAG: FHA domain-containing protein [Planctomycetaceae bacterium]
MEVRIVIVAPQKSRKAYSVRLPLVVGRGDEAKFRIPQDSVSRRHCEFALDGGVVTATDLGSTNGTFVGGRRLEPHVATPVSSGAEVRVGAVVLRVEYVAEAVAAAATPRDDDTVPLSGPSAPARAAADLPELEPVAETLPELEPVAESASAVEVAESAVPAAAVATPPSEPPAFPDVEPPAAPPADLAFPDAAPAADATDFAAIAGAEPTPAAAEGSFDFLAAEPAPPPADDKLDDFFKSLS